MKLLLLAILFFPVLVFAQGDKHDELNPDQLSVKKFRLAAQDSAQPGISLPFKRIRIIDSRFDSSKIGYIAAGLTKKTMYRKIVLEGGVENAIENYYNRYFEGVFSQNDFELLVVIKRLWISGNTNNSKRVELSNSVGYNNYIHYKWEYYIGKDGNYLPLKRIDTTFSINEDVRDYLNDELSRKRLYYFKQSLHTLIEMFDYSNAINQFEKQSKKTLAQIEEFNKRATDIPILKDSFFRKGVYLSFDDFKNNRPSIIDFQEKKMRYGRLNVHSEIYLEDMKGETIPDYWGYSDGKDFRYGMLGNEKIFRTQNTFCFFIKVVGYNVEQGNQGQYGGSGINTTSKNKYQAWVPFQIDMETGMIY